MRRWKKGAACLMIAAMVLGTAGCGSEKEVPATTQEQTTTEAQETTESTQEETTEAASDGNMIRNGDFSNGTSNFSSYTNGGQMQMDVNEEGQLQVDITKTGDVEHGVQVYYDGFEMKEGAVYKFSFDVKSTMDRDIDWRIQINGGDYHAYATETVSATDQMQHVETEFTMEEASDPAPRLCFNLGLVQSMQDAGLTSDTVGEHSVMLDNISLTLADDSQAAQETEAVEAPKVKVNQLGYGTKDKKVAVFSDLDEEDTTFKVVDAKTDKTVYEGDLTERKLNVPADEWDNEGDFSDLQDAGTYKVVSGKGAESYEFQIGDDLYTDTYKKVVKMLYLQRCGMELDSADADAFAHPACHTAKATVYGTSRKIDVSGGWHDAGDYGRYVVSGAKTVADLLLAFEQQSGKLHVSDSKQGVDDMGIPESGNGIHDLMDEVKYELDWMLKMQDSSGGVYHKVTCKVFPETVMPQDETDELIVSPISNTATGDFAAVMAMAGRIYTEQGEGEEVDYGKKCIAAAQKAWDYLEQHEGDKGFKNPDEIVTGEYADGKDQDEYLWAAAQLYKATGDSKYKDAMAKYVTDTKNMQGLGWADVGVYGIYAALTTDTLKTDSSTLYKTMQDALVAMADEVVKTSQDNPYGVDRNKSYEWGSNMGIANSGMLLLLANEVQPKEDYVIYAKSHLNYLMGVNATGYCFVTGTGTLSPQHPHHRPSEVLEQSMPGMLVGGPDNGLEDPYAKAVFLNTPAPKCYADNAQSYSTNEVTIYWNSPLIYLIAATQN